MFWLKIENFELEITFMAKLIFISFLFFTILAFRFVDYYQNVPEYHDGDTFRITATLREEPELLSGKQSFSLKTPDGVRIKIVTIAGPLYHFGDRLFIDGVFTKKEYKGFSTLTLYFPKIQIARNDHNMIAQSAFYIKNKAKALYESVLSPIGASLLLGIIFGGKEGMPETFSDALRTVGVFHVVAASGMNVSFVAGALLALFGKIFRRPIALVAGICGIVFYAFVAGFEPSIVRAAIMAVVAFSASLLGRQYLALFGTAFAGYVMLFLSPFLLFDVGFQLSFLSTMGILLIKPVLPLGKNMFLSDDIGTTIAAQIATLPVLLSVFGQYGVLSVLVNALVLWTVPVLMVFGSLGLLAGLIFAPLGKLFIFLCLPFLLFFEKVVSLFGSSGWMVQIESFPVAATVGYYLILVAVVLFINKRKDKPAPAQN